MRKHTGEAAKRNGLSTDELTALLLTIQRRLGIIQSDVDRLTLKERIDSLAARVADLEAKHG